MSLNNEPAEGGQRGVQFEWRHPNLVIVLHRMRHGRRHHSVSQACKLLFDVLIKIDSIRLQHRFLTLEQRNVPWNPTIAPPSDAASRLT